MIFKDSKLLFRRYRCFSDSTAHWGAPPGAPHSPLNFLWPPLGRELSPSLFQVYTLLSFWIPTPELHSVSSWALRNSVSCLLVSTLLLLKLCFFILCLCWLLVKSVLDSWSLKFKEAFRGFLPYILFILLLHFFQLVWGNKMVFFVCSPLSVTFVVRVEIYLLFWPWRP